MRCSICGLDYPENEIEESHDVPCYLFKGYNRKQKKNKADMYGRHWLCKNCHEKYEDGLRMSLIVKAIDYSNKYFKEIKK